MNKLKKVLLPIDLSHPNQVHCLLDSVVGLTCDQEIEIYMLYVDQSLVHRAGYPHLDEKNFEDHSDKAVQQIETFFSYLPKRITGIALCREGVAHDTIVEVATELNVDAVILMAQKPGLSSYFIGSNAERVVRHSPCSVFVIREDEPAHA
ncbi:universal stress protein [Terasakiella sp. A23]|uniref:universal stress protein n=1 Tax=Terasakiella sp. FCG-A23 TaxID=3080561 RepID=UPI002954C68D|nr:universal stress protein [Terasakiella sp. A23]MDV7341206.1 universal stress protein [Terasakiella sp. A23]